jgi:hypothetical protein
MTDEPRNGADILARIKPQRRERKCGITLRPDLLEAHEDAEYDLAKAREAWDAKQQSGTRRNAEKQPAELVELAEKVTALEDEIDATRLIVTFRAMNKPEWQALIEKYPPRQENLPDQIAGYDREAVKTALVRECLIEPEFDDESWAELENVINPSEWETLAETAYQVNSGVVDTPKSVLAAQVLSSRAPDSKPPKTGGSPPSGSTDGNPKKSTSSKTKTATPAN